MGLQHLPTPHSPLHASSVAAKKNKQTWDITLRGLKECALPGGAIPEESVSIYRYFKRE